MCTGLGLVAHLDGSHVRLLAFSGRGERSDGAGGVGIVADIDLEAGRSSQRPDDKRGAAASSLRREGGHGPSLATTFQGPARGLSWGRCSYSADSASAESGEVSPALGSDGGTGEGGGVGVRAGDGGGRGQGAEVACHIAVAWGSEVLLWKVSRVPCDARVGGSTEEGESGNNRELRYRYSTVSVQTDWYRCGRGSDSSTEREKTTIPSGNIRCLSFHPCGGGNAGLSATAGVVGRDENVPLTAWYDAGAAVLG